MRLTVLQNAMGANMMISNRSITNVIIYPRGYVRVEVNVTLDPKPERAAKMERKVRAVTDSVFDQFPGVFRASPKMVRPVSTPSGKTNLRIRFRVWPGRSDSLESTFKQELVQSLKAGDYKTGWRR